MSGLLEDRWVARGARVFRAGATNEAPASSGPRGGPDWANLERVARYAHPAFHEDACTTAHDGLGDLPLAVDKLGFGDDPQCAGGVAETHRRGVAANSSETCTRAVEGSGRAHRDR